MIIYTCVEQIQHMKKIRIKIVSIKRTYSVQEQPESNRIELMKNMDKLFWIEEFLCFVSNDKVVKDSILELR